MIKIYVSILAAILFIRPLAAQQLAGSFIAYGPESKFLSAQNFTVHQSSGGYLWIGNQNGLIRFDGKHYRNFFADHTNPNSPTDNSVVDITEDKNGDIWFCGFSNGLTRYNERTGRFKKYSKPTKDNFQFYGVNAAVKDQSGNIWFATAGRGLAQYLYNTDSFALFYPEPGKCKDGSVRGDNYVTGICEDKKDSSLLWITSFNGLYLFSKKNKTFTHYPYSSTNNNNTTIVFNNCDADAAGNLWIGTWGNGLLCFNTTAKQFVPANKKSQPAIVNHVKVISDSILFTACFNEGLYQLNYKTGHYTNITPAAGNTASLQNSSIHKISVTPDAGVFIGGNNYIYQYHPSFTRLKKNIRYEGAAEGTTASINSCLWDAAAKKYRIATSYGNGLYSLAEKETLAKKTPVAGLDAASPPLFNHLVKDAKNRWWVVHYFNGVYLLNEQKEMFEKPVKNFTALPDSLFTNIKSLQTDSAGNIWMLSGHSFIYYNVTTNRYTVFPVTWSPKYTGPKKYAPALFRMAPDGNVWLLTQNGFFVCSPATKKVKHIFETGSSPSSLPSASIEAGDFTSRKQFWINSGSTLHVYDWKTDSVLTSHTINAGLPSSTVKDIKSDKEGKIWVSTLAGLGLFDPAKKLWQTFNRFDGLETDYLDGSLFITNNKIIIDQQTGFVLKNIDEVRSSATGFRFRFTAIKINDKEWTDSLTAEFCTGLNLPYSENNISIEFAAMDWLYPFKTSYLYKIDGIQSLKTFSNIEENKINLAGLAPGRYVIHVKALSGSGVWSNEIVLPIIIRKPFWQTVWFIGLCVLALGVILLLLYKYRINQLKKVQVMRNNISSNLHDDIGASLSNINILNELAKRNTGNPEKSKEYLDKAGEDIQRISESLSDIVWNINTRYDDLQHLFIRMKRYAADMMDGKNIRYEMEFPDDAEKITLPMEQRRNLYLVFKEAINNLVKYSKTERALVSIRFEKKMIVLLIKDFGAGFNTANAGYGNGIANMRQRAAACHAKLEIASIPEQGTTIRLEMPVT
jgi:ligand-binding sensor domain-containing protein/two-component sensor histidine kinase